MERIKIYKNDGCKLGLILMDIGSPLTPSKLHRNYREHNGLTHLFTAKI